MEEEMKVKLPCTAGWGIEQTRDDLKWVPREKQDDPDENREREAGISGQRKEDSEELRHEIIWNETLEKPK